MNKEKKVVFMDVVGNEVNFEKISKDELFYAIFKRVKKMLNNNIDKDKKVEDEIEDENIEPLF